MRVFLLLLFASGLLIACQKTQEPASVTLFQLQNSSVTGIDFINTVTDGEDFNLLNYRNYYNGGGVAIGDVNGDDLLDIYFTSNMGPNKLYINKGNWSFEEVSASAGVSGGHGWSTGVTMADVNNDGLMDIYVCNSGDIQGDNKENELFINQGDGTFKEQAKQFGLNDSGSTTHASFFDYDGDGDLDCYILNNSIKDPTRIDEYNVERSVRDPFGGDRLLRNDNGYFTDVSEEAGIYGSEIGFGLGVSVGDLNGDNWPDIYVSNDFWERDYLYINQGDGTFSEELPERISVISISSMGSDVADINNDGSLEVFSTDMLAADNYRLKAATMFEEYHVEGLKAKASYHYQILQNCLQVNDGSANFQELGFLSGIASTDWSWGALALDLQNDGWKDYLVCNGIYYDIMDRDFGDFITDNESIKKSVIETGKINFQDIIPYLPSNPLPNYALVNQQDLTFADQAATLGLGDPSFSNGAAYGDLDNDGDLDLVVNNVNMPAFVYQNFTDSLEENGYLKFRFQGKSGNYFGIGSEVRVYANGALQVAQNYQSRGFQSSVPPELVFGMGQDQRADSVRVIWPDGSEQSLYDVASNQTVTLDQSQAISIEETKAPAAANPDNYLVDVSEKVLSGNAVHRENQYNDFDHERLLPHMLSTEGPQLIQGDLNGDGLNDLVLLGAAHDYDKIFIAKADGKFYEQDSPILKADSTFESTCGSMFDADGDGDQDLLIGSGGNEYRKGDQNFVLRYYENQNGKLVRNTDHFSDVVGDFSVVVVADLENDGDLDVFVGGRVVPGNYGLTPRSYLLRNDGAEWTDITPEALANIGMVTDAYFADLSANGWLDLMVVGEWMPVTWFENQSGELGMARTLENSEGWWNSITPADLDGDGDMDYILGNWGLNSKFKATVDRPLTMFVKDFDNNGKSEFVINWYAPLDSVAYPFASKMDITAQMPHLKKHAVRYQDYASMTYQQLISEEQRANALSYKTVTLESSILWNTSDGLKLSSLPNRAQVSPIFASVARDFDDDGNPDILLMGNFYGLKPEVGRQDSSTGTLLWGTGNGEFEHDPLRSGPKIRGQVRDAQIIKGANLIFIARNNSKATVLSWPKP